MQDPELFLGPFEAISCHLRFYRGWPAQVDSAMQAPQLAGEQEDLDDDDFACAEFLEGLRAASTPPAATQGTRTLPDLRWSSSSPVLGAPSPCHSQGVGVRCLACPCSELLPRLWVPDLKSPLVGWTQLQHVCLKC